jgi:alpha-ribazole phosphatase/probable phosphoglycerate mutase
MKNVEITYFVHGTTTDNEKGIATGWSPGELSKLGKEQMLALKRIIKGSKFSAAYCSDLKRAVDSARLLFEDTIPVVQDERLRECNYGDLTGVESGKVEAMTMQHIIKPFPNGESYQDVEKRIRNLLGELLKEYSGQKIAIVAHRAPQLALEVILNGKTWEYAIRDDWRSKKPKDWRPGWRYILKG